MTSQSSTSIPPIVLLHAFPLSHEMWNQHVLIDGYRLIKPDFPGFGGTPTAPSGLTLKQAARDLERQLETQKIAKPFILAGISMGGYWAFEYYRQFPDQVDQLILISTRPGVDKPEGRQNRLNMAERVEKEGIGFLPEAMIPGLLGKTTLAEKPEVKRQLTGWIQQTPAAAVASAQRAMANRRDQSELLPLIKARTLILAGQEDALIAPSEAEAMGRLIPNNLLKVIEGVGHLIPLESPQLFQKTVQDFLLS